MYDFFFWFSAASLIINILLILLSVGLFVANRKEKERRNSQVKIWMQTANGISTALQRILNDKWNNFYSSVQDVANTVHAIEASSFALYQSLYEERAISEEEYKKEQSELRKRINSEQQQQQQQVLPLAPASETAEDSSQEETSQPLAKS